MAPAPLIAHPHRRHILLHFAGLRRRDRVAMGLEFHGRLRTETDAALLRLIERENDLTLGAISGRLMSN